MRSSVLLTVCASFALVTTTTTLAQNSTYLAIGDSVGFGITTTASYTQTSNGDRGYVSLYADYLATQNSGIRPAVVNASIYGDSTSSYFDTSNAARALNTNYTSTISQNTFVMNAITQAAAASRPVTTVTVSLGANDLLSIIQQPGFAGLPAATQFATLQGAFGGIVTNLTAFYSGLRTALPTANIIAVGYYDPFAILPGNPNPALTAGVIQQLNETIRNISQAVGARYVDTYTPFLGNEATLTNMLLDPSIVPNVHPTGAGYSVIANQIIPAPGAGALVLLSTLAITRRRRVA